MRNYEKLNFKFGYFIKIFDIHVASTYTKSRLHVQLKMTLT